MFKFRKLLQILQKTEETFKIMKVFTPSIKSYVAQRIRLGILITPIDHRSKDRLLSIERVEHVEHDAVTSRQRHALSIVGNREVLLEWRSRT